MNSEDILSEERGNRSDQKDGEVVVSDRLLSRMKDAIDREICVYERRRLSFFRVLSMVASLLIPLMIASCLFLMNTVRSYSVGLSSVCTSDEEYTDVHFPDGSRCMLEPESSISFASADFSRDERTISFSGKGYFHIVTDEKSPFSIKAERFLVEVFGTEFYLHSNEGASCARLSLDNGSVKFTSIISGETVRLQPGHTIEMSNEDGSIIIYDSSFLKRKVPAVNLVFEDSTISDMVSSVGDAYGVRIVLDDAVDGTEHFTGILASDDLQGVIRIIERTCSLDAGFEGGLIIFHNRETL